MQYGVNETTIAELDKIAEHHHAGHSFHSYMPFSTQQVDVGVANHLLAERGIDVKCITWRMDKYGFGLFIKPKKRLI